MDNLDIVERLKLLPDVPHSVWRLEAKAVCEAATAEILKLRSWRKAEHRRHRDL